MLRHFYRLMVVALGLFVVSSCGEATPKYGNIYVDYDDGTVDEDVADTNQPDATLYGVAYVEYLVTGNVSSAEGDPVKDIKITLRNCNNAFEGKTDTQGNFAIDESKTDCFRPYPPSDATIIAEDVDGAKNGVFVSAQVPVVLDCTTKNGNYYTCTKADINIKLEEATSDDDTLLND